MKNLIFCFVFMLISGPIFCQQMQYSKVKVIADNTQLQKLAKAGINIREVAHHPGKYLVCDYSEKEIARILELGAECEILIEDVSKYYAERNYGLSSNPDDYKGVCEWEVPDNFEFGSMGGHCTYDEVVAHLDNMVSLFPDLITVKESIGQSIEGRDLWMIKISDNPNVNETEPEVLYTALHHGPEPAGVMTLLFYMYYMLENYDNDSLIQWAVDNSEIYFIPVVNPDGYVYNEQTNPNGGGMWRKNRRDNGIPGCEGVDINRNYGYMWGSDNIGSSPDPCSYQFRGDSAFSEPENIAIRDFCYDHEIKFTLNYHTYGSNLFYPWAHIPDPCPDAALYDAYSDLMIVDNQYYYYWYTTNGDADDWMYGEQNTKEKILAFTPELGNANDGSWCAIDRIIPIAQENMIMNIRLVQLAGNYAKVKEIGQIIYDEPNGLINFDITRLGLEDSGNFSVFLEPVSDIIENVGNPINFSNMDLLETQYGNISFELYSWVVPGTQFQFILSIDNGDYLISDTVTKIYGEAEVIFEDDGSSMDHWYSLSWNTTPSNFYSPPACITDSPEGNYPNNATSFIILNEDINLPDNSLAILNFQARWEIQKVYDYAELLIAIDGFDPTPLKGIYTNTGNNLQSVGLPVYDGFQSEWVQENINLQNYSGNTVNFMFILHSDNEINEDGFYIDDFKVSCVELLTNNEEIGRQNNFSWISDPLPNPAKELVKFRINNPGFEVMDLVVFNYTGQIVHSIVIKENMQKIVMNIDTWEPGIYFCALKTKEGMQTKKIIKL